VPLVSNLIVVGRVHFHGYKLPSLGDYCYGIAPSAFAPETVNMAEKSQQRIVKVAEFLEDMRSGLDDPGLMRKYDLSEIGLTRVLGELVRKGFISASQLAERSKIRDSQITKAFVEDQEGLRILD
jgi:hypothetical protein